MTTNGARDFDFVYGRWSVHNRKLRDQAEPGCEDWVEFDATSEVFPVLETIGHIDRIYVPNPPDGEPFEGFTLRLFDPAADLWQIWWSSTRAPGRLDPPMTGRFTEGHGVFHGTDLVGGRELAIRFEWDADPSTPVWKQSFSEDSGATWRVNWFMTLHRTADGPTEPSDRGALAALGLDT
jgi:hypothetical protein